MDIQIDPADVEEMPDLLMPLPDGCIWIPKPDKFCADRGYTALKAIGNDLFGLADKWENVERARLKVV